jgi:3-keto-disaccharide hydrolase
MCRYFVGAMIAALSLVGWISLPPANAADDENWAATVKFPDGEKPVKLFDGKSFDGWEGNTGEGGTQKYFTIKDGVIIARNEKENAPKVSNYLLTKKPYRNFRLILEGKLAESQMHSGVAIWGKKFEKDGEKNSYQGHLVMFPSGWGFYDLFRRNSIYQDKDGLAKKADNGGWNKMEILAIGNRIQLAVNGQAVADWSDPMPDLCQAGPIGLQLHSNTVPQEVQFRGLILSEDPKKEELITVEKK